MLHTVFASLVIAFWAAMMTALVRIEVFPPPTEVEGFSAERILGKVFSNPEPMSLDVYYNTSNHIGHCTIGIQPQMSDGSADECGEAPALIGYKVTSELNVRLSTFGVPSRLALRGESVFDKKLELERFWFTTNIGEGRGGRGGAEDGHLNVVGDDRTKKVQVAFTFGDIHDERLFDFNQIKGAGIANAFGLPGLANFSFLGGGGLPTGLGMTSDDGGRVNPTTTASVDRLEMDGKQLRAYLLYSWIDDRMWTKIWVDESGRILKVVTSMGLEMRTDAAREEGRPAEWTRRSASQPAERNRGVDRSRP
jgi:hypothetical protein